MLCSSRTFYCGAWRSELVAREFSDREGLPALKPQGMDKSQSVRRKRGGVVSQRVPVSCLALWVFLFLAVKWGRETECPRPVLAGAQECYSGLKACQREGEEKKVYSRIVGALAGSEVALEGPRKAPLWRDPQKQVFEKRAKERKRKNSRERWGSHLLRITWTQEDTGPAARLERALPLGACVSRYLLGELLLTRPQESQAVFTL